MFVSNAVKHFKFELRGKRRIHKSPTQREAAACLHWLEDEIALVRPQALVALGATAARSLLGRAVPVMAERGQWLARADGRQVLVTLHPSALLRVLPEDREEAFAAFVQRPEEGAQAVREKLGERLDEHAVLVGRAEVDVDAGDALAAEGQEFGVAERLAVGGGAAVGDESLVAFAPRCSRCAGRGWDRDWASSARSKWPCRWRRRWGW